MSELCPMSVCGIMVDSVETNRPVYHKDRLYTHSPPAGVSTGLGYLGNGSGAVMPVEINVSNISIRG